MRILLYVILLSFIGTFTSCKKLGLCKDEELSLERKDYTGNELRIDGFYFRKPESKSDLTTINYFYSNGLFLNPGSPLYEEIEESVHNYAKLSFNDTKYGWGVFIIEKDKIKIEQWGPGKCGYPVNLAKGKILNDSTFVLMESETRKGRNKEMYEFNTTYHFRQFDYKPDSTNNFIK